jgi:predicted ATPase
MLNFIVLKCSGIIHKVMTIQTNWCVITGAPSSGKTTVINALSMRGLLTAPEVAREYLSQLLKNDPNAFNNHRGEQIVQDKILDLKLEREHKLPADELIFFDRGVPDSLAYYRYYQLNTDSMLKKINVFKYAYVFYLEGLPVVNDDVRQEDEAQAKLIGQHIFQAYEDLGYDIIRIPAYPVEDRINQILSAISTDSLPLGK